MPRFAGVAGTTGYEALNITSRLLIEPRGLTELQRIGRTAARRHASFEETLEQSKRRVLHTVLASEFTVLAQALQDKGVRYLVQLTAMDLNAAAPGYGMVTVTAAPNVRVLDLSQHKVLWTGYTLQPDLFQLGGDLKKLEVDNMAKVKEGMANGARKIDFAGLWHLN